MFVGGQLHAHGSVQVAIVKRTEATVTTAKFYGFDIGPEQRWLEVRPPPLPIPPTLRFLLFLICKQLHCFRGLAVHELHCFGYC